MEKLKTLYLSLFNVYKKTQEERVISKTHDCIGGEVAITNLPVSFKGKVEVVSLNGESIAVTKNMALGSKISSYAITPDGGYGSVRIIKTKKKINVNNFEEWLS